MPRVIHFEIAVDDPERASAFYYKVFGWEIQKWDGPIDYWLITTGEDKEPGIDGALMRRENPSDSLINIIDVSSVDDFVEKITQTGGEVAVPKTAVPGVGYVAYCKDTEGNTFGIMQEDENAGS